MRRQAACVLRHSGPDYCRQGSEACKTLENSVFEYSSLWLMPYKQPKCRCCPSGEPLRCLLELLLKVLPGPSCWKPHVLMGPFGTPGILLQRRWEFSVLFEERYLVLREVHGPPLPKGWTRIRYPVCLGLYGAPLRWQMDSAECGRETPKAWWNPRLLGWSILPRLCWSAVIVPVGISGNSNCSSVGCVFSHLVFDVHFQNTLQ